MSVTRKSLENLTCSERVLRERRSEISRSMPVSRDGSQTLTRLKCFSICEATRYSPAWMVKRVLIARFRAAYRIALKLRATRPPAQGRGTKSVPRQGHNTPIPLRRSPPASFKRLLDGAPLTDARARRAQRGASARPCVGNSPMGGHRIEGCARRGMPVARPWGGGARRTDLRLGASALGAPHNHRTK